MHRLLRAVFVCAVVFQASAIAIAGTVTLSGVKVEVPAGFRVQQQTQSDGTLIAGFAKGDDYVTLYSSADTALDMADIFGHDAEILEDISIEEHGGVSWQTMETLRTPDVGGKNFVKAFMTELKGQVYYGSSRASSRRAAQKNADAFLASMKVSSARSLTGPEYKGKKYYFGFGRAMSWDPTYMHNEVKYDILHTHDIFTSDVGGGYIGTKLIGSSAYGSAIEQGWEDIGGTITANDMYLQYSSGHGSPYDLEVGVTYKEIRDNALAYPAKEVIVFIMACYSGALVNSFNAKKAEWEGWGEQGRTLFVFASSKSSQESGDGPITDDDEPGGPSGSAGSAFGWALWKALIGYSDGYVDGVKDGLLSLGEIRDYTIEKTKSMAGHTPVFTGVYSTGLILAKKPSVEFLKTLEQSTEGLSDEEIMQKIQELDQAMRIAH
jgi:hypothetical protein